MIIEMLIIHISQQALSQSALHPSVRRTDDNGRSSPAHMWPRRANPQQGHAHTYELSQDLADKRIEMLERRFVYVQLI